MKKKYKYDELPVYDMVIDEFDDTGIRFLSIVQDPAIELKGQYFKDQKFADDIVYPPCHDYCNCELSGNRWTLDVNACDFCREQKDLFDSTKEFSEHKRLEYRFFANKDEQKIVGPAVIPFKKIYRNDSDGEYMVRFSDETIRKMVRKFNSNGTNRKLNFNHSNVMIDGYIEQNWIIEDSMYDKSKVYGYELPKGTWFVEVKIEDSKFWKDKVKDNGFYSFSIEGIMGQKLISMSLDQHIDTLSDEEILDLFKKV